MPGSLRRHTPFDRDLELLPRPIPGWDAEWIHLGHGPVSNDAVRVTFGSGSCAVFQTSSAGILRGTNAADTVAFLGSLPATNLPRSHAQAIGSDAGLALSPGAAFDLYLPEGSGIIIFAVQSRRHPGAEPSPYRPGKAWVPAGSDVDSEETYSDSSDDSGNEAADVPEVPDTAK